MICQRCNQDITCGYVVEDGKPTCAMCMTSDASRSKLGNVRTEYGGETYDSKAEADRAAELDLLMMGGVVHHWTRQVSFALGCPENCYRADFVVYDDSGQCHVEDVKGHETAAWKKNKRLWRVYGEHPLSILKRKGTGWSREVVWPESIKDRSPWKPDLVGG